VQLAERGPGRGPPGGLGLGQRRGPGGERLVQPQVVPPAHGDQVAEPHVRHLVQDGLGAHLPGEVGDPGAEQVVLQERHAARVLHRAGLELRHEDLVVLADRVADPERVVEEVEALPGHLEDLLGIQVTGQRAAAVDAQRDAVVLARDLMVRAGHDGRDVGGHDRRRGEVPAPRAPGHGLAGAISGHVRQDQPVLGGDHRELERGLQVRLVEAGVDPVRVEGFQVGIQVDAVVGGVGEAVQTLPAPRVGTLSHHPQFVGGLEPVEGDPVAVERGSAHRHPVQDDLPDGRGGQLDEAGRLRDGALEVDGAGGQEGAGTVRQVQFHPV